MHVANAPCSRILEYRPPRIAVVLVALATALDLLLGGPLHTHPPFVVFAIVTGLGGILLMLRAWWLFKVRDTAICPTAETSALITNDVYAWTRNPMYLGIVLMTTGIALFTGSLLHYLAAVFFFAIIDHSFCSFEEAKLARLFGEEFRMYTKQTRRWL